MNLKSIFINHISLCTLLVILSTTYSLHAQNKKSFSTNYSEESLSKLSLEELALRRNEILARKGYTFTNPLYNDYFTNQKWYTPTTTNTNITLTSTENNQIDLIKKVELQKKEMRAKSIKDLKDLRNALNTNDYNTINRILNLPNDERRIDQQLRKTLNVCDIDDIHWNKSEGIYEASIDNGLNTRVYTIKYSRTQVILSYAQTGASELSMYTYEVSPGYFSESITLYIFDITENGLKLKKIDGAG